MDLQKKIEQDLKSAMLAGDKTKVETLKGIKNALQYETVAVKAKEEGLSEEQVQKVLARESKKRQEAAQLYKQGNSMERAEAELAEKEVIDAYLPEQLDEAAISELVDKEVAKFDSPSPAEMGKIIGAVRAKLGANADGATIARLVKAALEPNE